MNLQTNLLNVQNTSAADFHPLTQPISSTSFQSATDSAPTLDEQFFSTTVCNVNEDVTENKAE